MEHIWTLERWKKNIDDLGGKHRRGLRMRYDKEVDINVKKACKEFVCFLRKKYYFPLRVVVYVKKQPRIVAMDGEKVCGTFWFPIEGYEDEPHIKIATGDYTDMCEKWGEERAISEILWALAHELTHYFQWINALNLTPIGMERQANRYGDYLLDEFYEYNNTQ